jgi:FKBP-type peptidyl-prolyl cis-trans isomerase
MNTPIPAPRRHPVALLALALLLAACRGERAGDTASDTTSTPAASSVINDTSAKARATYAPALNVDLAAMRQTPGGVLYRDLVTGTGAEVDSGTTVGIYYTGNLTDGRQFDANQPPRPPYSFSVKTGDVIPGFDEGVMGMRRGGRRQVIIPPELGYGAQGIGPIPPNAILVFTIEVAEVR